MDGFYEWQAGSPGGPLTTKGKPAKQPMFIRRLDGEPLAVAGLWAAWRDPTAGPEAPWLHSCTVLTTTANADHGADPRPHAGDPAGRRAGRPGSIRTTTTSTDWASCWCRRPRPSSKSPAGLDRGQQGVEQGGRTARLPSTPRPRPRAPCSDGEPTQSTTDVPPIARSAARRASAAGIEIGSIDRRRGLGEREPAHVVGRDDVHVHVGHLVAGDDQPDPLAANAACWACPINGPPRSDGRTARGSSRSSDRPPGSARRGRARARSG